MTQDLMLMSGAIWNDICLQRFINSIRTKNDRSIQIKRACK